MNATLRLPEHATLDEAPALLQTLAAEGGPAQLVDASALKVFDSSAIALLLQASRLASAGGARLVVQGAPPKLLELVQLYGVEELLSFEPRATGASAGGVT